MFTGNRFPRKHSQTQGIVSELHRQILNGPTTVGAYAFLRTIGEGSFSKVKLGVHKLTDQRVAIKCVDRIHAPAIVREVETWRNMHHPNIVKLYEVLVTESKIYMVTEFCDGGETFEYIYSRGRMSDRVGGEARRVFFQIVDAVRYCHEKNFVHRDLKLENILLTSTLDVKLIDFGFTRSVQTDNLLDTYCGSIAYAAPEMITASKYSGPEVDVWSLGVILYTLVCGYLPFDDDNEATVRRKIVDNEYVLPDFLEDDTKELISSILQTSGSLRITVRNLLAHPWFRGISDAPLFKDVDNICEIHADLIANLKRAGVDTDTLVTSVRTNACDSLYALFHLLLGKQESIRKQQLLSNSIADQGANYTPNSMRTAADGSSGGGQGTFSSFAGSSSGSLQSLYQRESTNSTGMMMGVDSATLTIDSQRNSHYSGSGGGSSSAGSGGHHSRYVPAFHDPIEESPTSLEMEGNDPFSAASVSLMTSQQNQMISGPVSSSSVSSVSSAVTVIAGRQGGTKVSGARFERATFKRSESPQSSSSALFSGSTSGGLSSDGAMQSSSTTTDQQSFVSTAMPGLSGPTTSSSSTTIAALSGQQIGQDGNTSATSSRPSSLGHNPLRPSSAAATFSGSRSPIHSNGDLHQQQQQEERQEQHQRQQQQQQQQPLRFPVGASRINKISSGKNGNNGYSTDSMSSSFNQIESSLGNGMGYSMPIGAIRNGGGGGGSMMLSSSHGGPSGRWPHNGATTGSAGSNGGAVVNANGLMPGTRRKSFSSILDSGKQNNLPISGSRRGIILNAMQRPAPTKERPAVMEVDEEEGEVKNTM